VVLVVLGSLWPVTALAAPTSSPPVPTAAPSAAAVPTQTPVYAYFYQWFQRSSWNRAKQDLPLAGKYSSDDPHVLREQVQQAQAVGIDGFLASWKDTPTLDRRLELLLTIAATDRFDVGIVYEALDFTRQPLPIATVRADMLTLVTRFGDRMRSAFSDRPVIIWTGIDRYTVADVRSVRTALGDRALLLATSKQVADYNRIADLVDGEAYYWSSADPTSSFTREKLRQFGRAVHRRDAIWIAPAAPGFDGRTLGHSRVIPRSGGATLRSSLDNAYATHPDAVGVISWNEWSENTYIEAGHRYGDMDLTVLRQYLLGHSAAETAPARVPHANSWSGLRAAALLTCLSCLTIVLLVLRIGRRPAAPARPAAVKQRLP
jgi:hypothetical protein